MSLRILRRWRVSVGALALVASTLPGSAVAAEPSAVKGIWHGAFVKTDCVADGVDLQCTHELDSERPGNGLLSYSPCREIQTRYANGTPGVSVTVGCWAHTINPLQTVGTIAPGGVLCSTATTTLRPPSTRTITYDSVSLGTRFNIVVTATYESGVMEITGTGDDSTGQWTATLNATVASNSTTPCGTNVRGVFSGNVKITNSLLRVQ